MRRYATLRLARADLLIVKEPSEPCVMAFRPSEPLSDAQLRRLALATPWDPIMIQARPGRWEDNAFDAEVNGIESQIKFPEAPKPRRPILAKKQHARLLRLT
jgi:hypothetical protein